jgi:hypothetical protein
MSNLSSSEASLGKTEAFKQKYNTLVFIRVSVSEYL